MSSLEAVRMISNPIDRCKAAMTLEEELSGQVADIRVVRDLAIHEIRGMHNGRGKPNSIREVAELIGKSKTLVASILE